MSSFKTVQNEAFGEFIEKRSKFICYGKHVTSKIEAEKYVDFIKAKHWDAKHNVYAYRIRNGMIKKASDDGEPQGTAGMPALSKLEGMEVEDVVVVITRYFGGILLGTGGLTRAYSYGAEVAVKECGIVEMKLCVSAKVKMDYDIFGKIEGVMRNFGANISDCTYTNVVEVSFYVEEEKFDKLEEIIHEISGGKCNIFVENKAHFMMG